MSVKLFYKEIILNTTIVKQELKFKTFDSREAAVAFATTLKSPSHIIHYSITSEEVQTDFCEEVFLAVQKKELAEAQKVVQRYADNGFRTKAEILAPLDFNEKDC